MIIKGLDFVQTCFACPEQYDVKDSKGEQVGYVRLRYGILRCDYPDVGGKTIYQANFEDELMGIFEDEEQREYTLEMIADKILEEMKSEQEE